MPSSVAGCTVNVALTDGAPQLFVAFICTPIVAVSKLQ